MHVFLCIYDLLLHILSIWKHALSSSLIIMVKTFSFLPQATLIYPSLFSECSNSSIIWQLLISLKIKELINGCMCICVCVPRCVWLHRLKPARCFCPWIFQTRKLVNCRFFLRGSSWPRDQTHFSCTSSIGRWILYHLEKPNTWM